MSRVQKKPLSEEQIRAWIKYSFKGLMMAKEICDRKKLDYYRICNDVQMELIEEVNENGYT